MKYLRRIIRILRIGGVINTIHVLARELLRRIYANETHWGMTFDLNANLDLNRAARPLNVRPLKPSDINKLYGYCGLDFNVSDLRTILEHLLFLDSNIMTPYVGVDAQDNPTVICWLITAHSNCKLRRYFGKCLPVLRENEILLEFIYTRPDCRGQHLMRHLTNALFRIGRQSGMQKAHAYINASNQSSLAGSKRIGWKPYVTKKVTWRWFRRRIQLKRFEGQNQEPRFGKRAPGAGDLLRLRGNLRRVLLFNTSLECSSSQHGAESDERRACKQHLGRAMKNSCRHSHQTNRH